MLFYDCSIDGYLTLVTQVINEYMGFLSADGQTVIAKPGRYNLDGSTSLMVGATTAYVTIRPHPTEADRGAIPVDSNVLQAIRYIVAKHPVLANLPAPAELDASWTPIVVVGEI